VALAIAPAAATGATTLASASGCSVPKLDKSRFRIAV
jgi:hypothetical protein